MIGLVAAIGLGLLVARMVIRPVTAVRDGLVAMAAGDLTAHVDVTSTDEVGQMADGAEPGGREPADDGPGDAPSPRTPSPRRPRS